MPRQADPALSSRRRRQILEAAQARFRERGFRLTTIEEICAEARISPGALYRYFGSKADLIAAIALDARADAESMLDRIDGGEGLLDGIAELAKTYIDLFRTDGALLADIWAEATRDPALAKALVMRDRISVARISAAIERAQARGEVYPALRPEEVAETLMAALEGMSLRRTLRGENATEADVLRLRALALHLLKPKR